MNEIEIEEVSGLGGNTKVRAMTLAKTRIGDIPFPMRFITGTDLNHAQKVISVDSSLTIPFTSKVYGINRSYDKSKLDAIAKGKSRWETEFTQIIADAKRKDGVLTALLANIDPTIAITDSHDDQLIMLQAGLDTVSIFDSRHIGDVELAERIRRDIKLIKEFDKEKIVVVRTTLRQPIALLERKLDLIFSIEEVSGVFIQYGNPDYAYAKLALLRKYARKPKWIHMFGVPKWATDKKTSMMHVLLPFSIDSFSLRRPKPFQPDHIVAVKRMNWRLGGYLEFPNEHRQTYEENLDCEADCPPEHEKHVKDILDKYSPEDRISEARVHEAYEGQYGFQESRIAILSEKGAIFKLYKAKPFLRDFLQRTENIDFRIKPIF